MKNAQWWALEVEEFFRRNESGTGLDRFLGQPGGAIKAVIAHVVGSDELLQKQVWERLADRAFLPTHLQRMKGHQF